MAFCGLIELLLSEINRHLELNVISVNWCQPMIQTALQRNNDYGNRAINIFANGKLSADGLM